MPLVQMEKCKENLCGDTPLIKHETMEALLNHHEKMKAKATVLTVLADDPSGYGRIIRDENGHVEKIVEHKDATEAEREVQEINSGTYCFDNKALFSALNRVNNDNVQGEYYLPDVIEILKDDQEIVTAYQTDEFEETLGVNDRVALSEAEQFMKKRINEFHMKNGVTIIDPLNTYIGPDVIIGMDTILHPGTTLSGNTVIGSDCVICPHSEIADCTVGDRKLLTADNAHVYGRMHIL